MPVDEDAAPLPTATLLGDRRNMAYADTLVAAGQGTGMVVATGDATQMERISRLIAQSPELTTPLACKMGVFAQRLLVAILVLAGVTFAVGLLRGESAFNMFIAAVALAVGAIPEGLPAAMTVTLAMGAARMAKRRAIIRKLQSLDAVAVQDG